MVKVLPLNVDHPECVDRQNDTKVGVYLSFTENEEATSVGGDGEGYYFFAVSIFFPMSDPRNLTPSTRSSFPRIWGFGIALPDS